jgi:hypothetical protein
MPKPKVDAGTAQKVCLEGQLRFPWRGGDYPWLDVVVTTQHALIGIEAKRYEPFRDQESASFSKAYLRHVWGKVHESL